MRKNAWCFVFVVVVAFAMACGRPPDKTKGGFNPPPPVADVGVPDMGMPDNGAPDNQGKPPDVVCVPDCQNKQCGDDGCGGVCGECGEKACKTAVCESGSCVYKPITCDDGSVCTTDLCDQTTGKCVFAPIVCDDGDACTKDVCDPAKGCVATPVVCADMPGLVGTCDPAKGCVYAPPAECQVNAECKDSNACTTDSCVSGKCEFLPVTCDDSNACTADYCDLQDGTCVHISKVCDDGDACTTDSCDAGTGKCVFAPIVCDDGDACTTDTCDKVKGCEHTAASCDDGDACTTDSCDSKAGCVHVSLLCDDGDACTTDSCDKNKGCASIPVDCDDSKDYTDDSCAAGKCVHTVKSGTCFKDSDCQDGNACTEDVCDSVSNQCKLVEIKCDDGNPCTLDKCFSAPFGVLQYTCAAMPVNCDDGDACTSDSCDPKTGQCKSEAYSCDDGDSCTKDFCDPKTGCQWEKIFGCCHVSQDCDDSSPYTEDICVNGACKYADTQFVFQCTAAVKQAWQGCECEVWAFYGAWEPVDGLSCLEKKTAAFGPGDKISSKAICNSWWENYNDPIGAKDSALLEVNARMVCPTFTIWIGGEFVQVMDSSGALVPMVVLHQGAKGIGWQDGYGVWHGRNYGAQKGIPWCKANPPPPPCE